MAAEKTQTPIVCPECAAENPPWRLSCFVCHGPLERSPEGPATVVGRHAPGDGHQYGLGFLMLGIALLAIFLGLFREWPLVATLFAIVVVLAITITQTKIIDRRLEGVPLDPHQKAITFLRSLGIVLGWLVLGVFLIGMVGLGFVILLRQACGAVFGR
jgi:hypothetical protein